MLLLRALKEKRRTARPQIFAVFNQVMEFINIFTVAQRLFIIIHILTNAWYDILIYHKRKLLLSCLEAAVTKLGGGVNKFEINRFLRLACGLLKQRLKHRHVRNKHDQMQSTFR